MPQFHALDVHFHPFQTELCQMLREQGVELATISRACDCSIQRAKNLLANRLSMTVGEYAALLNVVERDLPPPRELRTLRLTDAERAARNTTVIYKAGPSRRYKPVADEHRVMASIMRARTTLLDSMPEIAGAAGAEGTAWLEAAAGNLWKAAGQRGDARATLAEFCVKMSLAVLRSASDSLGPKNAHALRRYIEKHSDALVTPYDMIVRFAPEPVVALPAAQIYARFASEHVPQPDDEVTA